MASAGVGTGRWAVGGFASGFLVGLVGTALFLTIFFSASSGY